MDPCILEIRRDLGNGSELKVFVDACLERLKDICCWEDGWRKRIPVSRCHRDKRIGECVCWIRIQFKRGVKIAYFAQMKPLEGLLILSCQNKSHGNICKKRERAETDLRWAGGSRVSEMGSFFKTCRLSSYSRSSNNNKLLDIDYLF